MKIAIGLGLDKNPEKAAEEAVKQALRTVPKPGLAVAFASIHLDQEKVHKALCRHLDPAILTGGSCYAEITNAGVSRNSVAVLLISGERLKASFSVSEAFQDCRKTGLALAAGIPPLDPAVQKLSLLFGSIKTGYEQLMVDAISEKLGTAPVFGGLTCGDYDLGMAHPEFWTNYQFCGRSLSKTGARLAALELPAGSKLGFGYGHGWEPVGEELEITRAEGPEVYELNGVPVIEFYRQFLGRDAGDKFFELMVQRYGFSIAAPGSGKTLIKLPVSCDFKKGSIRYFPAEEMRGKKVRLIQASRLSLVEGARAAAKECAAANPGKTPALVFMVSCCSRSHILHSRENDEVDAVRSVFGRAVPVFGFYSGGEIVPWLSSCAPVGACGSFYHTTTVALMALYADGRVKFSAPKERRSETQPAGPEKVLLARSEEMLDTTESFLANLSRKSYKDGELLRRQHEMIHAYTPHGVWEEVGAVTSAGGQELKDAEFTGVFMFMDVKGFTTYSEAHTSAEVVKALNEIFSPATGLIYEHGGDVDKFIGDCIFACFASAKEAALAAKAILLLFRELKAKGNPFDVRIGLNGGRAVRANVGAPNRREYTFIGDAVNTAQRLESNCEPGKALLSSGVYAEAASVFGSASEKIVTLKGKAKPITAFLCEP
ncbi:MAG: adenylate/guanylate cyclase domain-containing protein [Elusimicrobiota bacterium]|nr:adenylate/guanylate cyclase domain-containing protein [Elusimicrobiota bacterium]